MVPYLAMVPYRTVLYYRAPRSVDNSYCYSQDDFNAFSRKRHVYFFPEKGAFIIHSEKYQPRDGAYNHAQQLTEIGYRTDNHTNYTIRRAGMNSVTGESNPVSTGRSRPSVSNEVFKKKSC